MTDTELRQQHFKVEWTYCEARCYRDNQLWPCDVTRLLDDLKAAREALEDARCQFEQCAEAVFHDSALIDAALAAGTERESEPEHG